MKAAFLLYVVLLIVGAFVIHSREGCERLLANRDLVANHLVQAADWKDDSPQGLACARTERPRLVGRYLKGPLSEGMPVEFSKTLVKPALLVPPNHSLFWLGVKDSQNLYFAEPGTRFDACDASACPLTALRVEAVRCTPEGTSRLCEVAVIVPEADAAKIAQVATKSFRMVFRQDGDKKG